MPSSERRNSCPRVHKMLACDSVEEKGAAPDGPATVHRQLEQKTAFQGVTFLILTCSLLLSNKVRLGETQG